MYEIFGRKTILLLATAFLLPPTIMVLYLGASVMADRWLHGVTDWIAIGGSIIAGAIALYRLPFRPAIHVASLLIYLPTMAFALLLMSLTILCYWYGDCL